MAEPLRIRFVPGVTPGKWLRIWSQRMPDSPLEATPVEESDQRTVLVHRAADMCFVRLPVDREGLHVIPLYREVPVVVAAKEHPIAAFDEIDVADLAAEHLLQDPDDVPEWRDVATELREDTRAETPPMTTQQAIEVAASGAGVVIVPMSVARLHHRKDVVRRPVGGVAESQIGLAWRTDNDDPRIETFIGIVRGRTERSSRGDGGSQGRQAVARRGDRQQKRGQSPSTGTARKPRGGPRRRRSG